MKSVLVVIFLALSLCNPCLAGVLDSEGGTISANVDAQEVVIGKKNLYLFNDGSDEVYFTLSHGASVTATNSDFFLNVNQDLTIRANKSVEVISVICNNTETATVRYLAWD